VSSFAIALCAALLVIAVIAVLVRWRKPEVAPIEVEAPADVAPLEGVSPAPELGPRPAPLPIVLVHGLFGFDQIGVPGAKLQYFRGMATHLKTLGCDAHAVRLPPAAAVPDRAKLLVEAIAALGHDRVDVIAHSLGGLDARYALSKLGLASRVRSLVTIGTPHRGTPLADLATDGAVGLARRAIGRLGVPLHALDWLTTAALERFNAEVKDDPNVRYACVVGGLRDPRTPIALAIAPAHAYLRRVAGANDGLVPMSSQYWGETLAEIEADHFAQIGWRLTVRHTFDALGLYAYVVSRLGVQLENGDAGRIVNVRSATPRNS
jgi:triacylglycerol lipase